MNLSEENLSAEDIDEIRRITADAAPLARAMMRRARAISGDTFGIEVPLAFALGLVACCSAGSGWEPEDVVAMAVLVGREATQ